MRVSLEVEPVLFPILADALEGRNIQLALVPSIRRSPRWLANFVNFVIVSGKNSGNLADAIMVAGGLPKEPELYRTLETQILGTLANAKNFETLQAYYESLNGADKRIYNSTDFSSVNTDARFSPLTWQPFSTTTITSMFDRDAHTPQKQLTIQISGGERANAARKLLFLTPGRKAVAIRYEFIDPGKDASATITIECANSDTIPLIWQMEINAVSGAQTKSSVAVIPEKCPAQYVKINVAGGSASQGMQLVARNISLLAI